MMKCKICGGHNGYHALDCSIGGDLSCSAPDACSVSDELLGRLIDSFNSLPDMGGKDRFNCTPKSWHIIRQIREILKQNDLNEPRGK